MRAAWGCRSLSYWKLMVTVTLIVWFAATGTTGGVAGVVDVAGTPRERPVKGNAKFPKATIVKTVSMVPFCVASTVPASVNWTGRELVTT